LRRRTKWLLIGVVSLLLIASVANWVWDVMGRPMYEPGMVRSEMTLRGPLELPEQPTNATYWQVAANIRLSYLRQGSGPPILIVHGGPGYPIRDALPGLSPLAERHTLYYYDQRGCGRSTRPFDRFESKNYYANMQQLERTLGIGAQVADIEQIRRILGQDKLVLLGHSFGGFLAAMYAAEFPERVESLILVAPAGVLVLPDEKDGFFDVVRARLPASAQAEYDRFLKEYLDFGSVFSRSEAELAQRNRTLGEYFLRAEGAGGQTPPIDNGGWMVQAMYFSMGRRHDYRAALKNVQAPVLVIHGEGDLVPERLSRAYADAFPRGRLHVMRGAKADHFLMSEPPDGFSELLTAFLEQPDQ
jgi:proline iminopeptidase